MSSWGSKWLEREVTLDSITDDNAADLKTSSSGRHHGTRWFNVVQGIRRSLDVHLKSYYKVDSAFASTLKFTSPSDKLKALSRSLTGTGLIDFCCIYLIHPSRGTFGIVALSGAGSELYPPVLSEEAAQRAAHSCDAATSPLINVFTRCVFQVKDSNWAVEDVATSRAPWYYDCASAANGFGLPQDGAWLRRAGMRSMLALPCLQHGEVTGVLAVASKQTSLDHLLLRKLEELCYKVTPVATDAVSEHSKLLCNHRVAARYESICDFAHEVLGEMLNLDRAVALSSVSCGKNTNANSTVVQTAAAATTTTTTTASCNGALTAAAAAAPAVTVRHHGVDVRGGSCSSRGRRGDDGASHFDAAAAMAAAAAAGFSWTAPSAPAAAATATTVAGCSRIQAAGCSRIQAALAAVPRMVASAAPEATAWPVACARQQEEEQQQQDENDDSPQFLQTSETFCSALTDTTTTEMFSATLPSEPLPLVVVQAQLATIAVPQPVATPTVPHVNPAMCRSLPARCVRAAHDQVVDYFLRSGPAECARQLQQQQCGGSRAMSTSDHCATRSTRSLSCLEFSGGVPAGEIREALASDYSVSARQAGTEALSGPSEAVQARNPHASSPPAQPQQQLPQRKVLCDNEASALSVGPTRQQTRSSSNRTTESGAGEGGYMLETCTTEELARAPQGGFMISPSNVSSRNTERRVIHRIAPLEPSVGAAVATAAATAASSSSRVAPVAAAAAALVTARGSTCATDASAAADSTFTTTTTNACGFGHTFLAAAGGSHHGLWAGCSAAPLSNLTAAWASECAGCEDAAAAEPYTLMGRWSRDSAAAAAAMWSNEAAEAFAAAMRFTASQQPGRGRAPCVGKNSGWVSHRGPVQTPAAAAAAAAVPVGMAEEVQEPHACFGGMAALGGLYGIRESGPVPSLALSLEDSGESGSDDFSVVVLDPSSCGGFFLSSGLGAEAQERHLATMQQSAPLFHHSPSEGALLSSDKLPLVPDSQQWAPHGEVMS